MNCGPGQLFRPVMDPVIGLGNELHRRRSDDKDDPFRTSCQVERWSPGDTTRQKIPGRGVSASLRGSSLIYAQ